MANHLDPALDPATRGAEMQDGGAAGGLLIFLFALAVRLYLLYDLADNPSFDYPLVDAGAHHRLALALQESNTIPTNLFWRSVFYPLYLGASYFVTGSSIVGVKLFQAFLGALTCFVTYQVGRRAFGHACGVAAGLITALYGPLLFWESELVAVGWAAFWSVALLWLGIRLREGASPRWHLVFGLAGGLAVLTRPSFLPFVLLTMIWLAWTSGASARARATTFAVASLGFCTLTLPTALVSGAVSGHASFLPRSGALNLYLGNHPDRCQLLQIRPGEEEWRRLADPLVDEAGANSNGPADGSAGGPGLHRKRFIEYASAQPSRFAAGISHKLWQLANGREIPRNVDIYLFREWSPLLSALLWKAGSFGFPFGLLFPLAVVGLWLRRREVPAPLLILIVSYPLVIAATFVAGRYRAPLIPALSLLAGAAVVEIARRLRRGEWRSASLVLAAGALLAFATNRADSFCEEQPDFHSEMYSFIAMDAGRAGDIPLARALHLQALSINPESPRAHEQMANFLAAEDELDDALGHYERAAELAEDYWVVQKRGAIHLRLDEFERALADFDRAIALKPDYSPAYLGRAHVYFRRGELRRALANARRALAYASGTRESAAAQAAVQSIRRRRPSARR